MCWRMWETVGYSVMNAITFISAPQKGHNKGSISYIDERRPAESGAAAEGLVVGNGQGGGDAGRGADACGLDRGNKPLRGSAAAFAA